MSHATQSAAIRVEHDGEGLHMALVALFEESLIRHRLGPMLEKADATTKARALSEIPERQLSPGYFLRAAYLLELAETMQLGVAFDASSFCRADIVGLKAVRQARADYEHEHPACGACGERQDNRWMKECRFCHAKFGGTRS